MTGADKNVVEQSLRIKARPETVWKYWTDPQRICEWWGSAAQLDPQPGGVCRIEMGGGNVMRGEFVELVPFERLVFTFGWETSDGAPEIGPGESRVEVSLIDDSGDTILTLRHSGLPGSFSELHAAGWAHFLPLLVAAVQAPS